MDGTYDWDSEENIRAVERRVSALLNGCKCRTGCTSTSCGCRKKGDTCSAGCNCIGCVNTDPGLADSGHDYSGGEHENSGEEDGEHENSGEEDGEEGDQLEREVDNIMDWVFGV